MCPPHTHAADSKKASTELAELKQRFESQAEELQRVRKKCLPA